MSRIEISPVTRISGQLSVELYPGACGVIEEANCIGDQFRGFEAMLSGRAITDAIYFTERICGICSMAHGYTAARLVGQIYGIKLTPEIRRLQQAMFGAEFLQNHIRHFYLLALPDYLDATDLPGREAAPDKAAEEPSRFSSRQQSELLNHYFAALEYSRKCHEMLAVFGGKIPHQHGLVAEGVSVPITADRRAQFLALLTEVRQFIEEVMVPDSCLLAEVYGDYSQIGTRPARYISYGLFEPELGDYFPAGIYANGKILPVKMEEIRESIRYSWYKQDAPEAPDPDKPGAYSWVKAPRYLGMALEGGPLARKVIRNGGPGGVPLGAMGRLIARVEEAAQIAAWMLEWVMAIPDNPELIVPPGQPVLTQAIQANDAPRGPLMHVIATNEAKITGYDVITPTTWNFSPKDDAGQRGPAEEALVGTFINPGYTAAPGRIIRSFDPCLNCAAHYIDPANYSRMRLNIPV